MASRETEARVPGFFFPVDALFDVSDPSPIAARSAVASSASTSRRGARRGYRRSGRPAWPNSESQPGRGFFPPRPPPPACAAPASRTRLRCPSPRWACSCSRRTRGLLRVGALAAVSRSPPAEEEAGDCDPSERRARARDARRGSARARPRGRGARQGRERGGRCRHGRLGGEWRRGSSRRRFRKISVRSAVSIQNVTRVSEVLRRHDVTGNAAAHTAPRSRQDTPLRTMAASTLATRLAARAPARPAASRPAAPSPPPARARRTRKRSSRRCAGRCSSRT